MTGGSPASTRGRTAELIFGGEHSRGLGPTLADLGNGFARVDFWSRFAWNDVRARYRRSRIGEFWMVISIGVFIFCVGVVYGMLFGVAITDYLPYLCVGYVLWLLFSTFALDGCQTFISANSFLRQQRVPLTALALRVVHRAFIVFAHNAVAVVVVFAAFRVWPGWHFWLVIPALALWWLNGIWMSLTLGIICARFRDIPQLVSSMMQILFLVTPVLWSPAGAPPALKIVGMINPVAHFLAIVRDPLLGSAAPLLSWTIVIAVTAVGWGATVLLMVKYRARVPYWT